jgi:hypothetical protein
MKEKQWKISSKIGRAKKWVSKNNPVVIHVANESVAKKLFGDTDLWQSLMDDYLSEILLPEMARRWAEEEGDQKNYPQIITSTSYSDAQDRAGGNSGAVAEGEVKAKPRKAVNFSEETKRLEMQTGFRHLFGALTTKVPVAGIGFGLGPMNSILELKLSRYMPYTQGSTSSKSEYNTLFYAIEFGTGMLAGTDNGKPGNPSYIRTSGKTKDPRPRFKGSWWFGPRPGVGIHWKGQQGAHFLHDARTREIRDDWKSFFETSLPAYIKDRLGQGGR